MKAGPTPHIRMSPQDAMACIDIVEKVGVSTTGMSFAMVAKIALTSLIESARQNGLIPKRDGWEYGEMMKRFGELTSGSRAAKLQMNALVQGMGAEMVPQAIAPETPERRRRRVRFEELKFMYDADPENHPLPIPGTPEFAEWDVLCQEFAS